MVYVDGTEYAVDFRRRTFESTEVGANGRASVRFDSPLGRQLWNECMILECRRCGELAVELRHMSGVRCDACGAWLVV